MKGIEYAKHIFERLGIKHPIKTVVTNLYNFDDFSKTFGDKKIKQYGGKKDTKLSITYNGVKYNFTHVDDDGYLYYAMYHYYKNKNDNSRCIMIVIEKEIRNCAITTLSYDNECFPEDNDNGYKWSGSDLLKLALKFINYIKGMYKLKTITLTDNSNKQCNNKVNIELNLLSVLTSGDTWYGKYGFRPTNKKIYDEYGKNKKIIEKIKLSDVPQFRNMLMSGLTKYYSKNKKMQNEIMGKYEKYLNSGEKLKTYLIYLLTKYDKTCQLFEDFYRDLAKEIGITSMYGKSFILDI